METITFYWKPHNVGNRCTSSISANVLAPVVPFHGITSQYTDTASEKKFEFLCQFSINVLLWIR